MSPSPSSSDEPALPPRDRSSQINPENDFSEEDLWALDEINLTPVPPSEGIQTGSQLPEARPPETTKVPAPRPAGGPVVNYIGKSIRSGRHVDSPSGARVHEPLSSVVQKSIEVKSADDFGDLDDWEQADTGGIPTLPAQNTNQIPAKLTSVEAPERWKPPSSQEKITKDDLSAIEGDSSVDDDTDEFSTSAQHGSKGKPLTFHLGLSSLERIGFVVLTLLLLGAGVYFVMFPLNHLPMESHLKVNHFPIKGQQFSILSAESYWRTPVTTGDHPDVVRRGTVLIPVILLKTGHGTGAIRIVFRNEDKNSVGDVLTQSVKSDETIEIAGTAGFNDFGIYAGYRTGDMKPWMIEVYEASSVDASPDSFKKLFKLPVSTDFH
jgi:hypothetical protein